jgi:hypothetical protein
MSLELSPIDMVEHLPTSLSSFIHSSNVYLSDAFSITLPDATSFVQDASSTTIEKVTEAEEIMSLESIGHDILLFLAAAVVVDPLGKILGVTPVLLYLILGFVAGPYGLR